MNVKPFKESVLIAAIAFAGYGNVHAQVTTSNMTGIVSTRDGKQTSGARTTATHLPSGTVYSATANASGAFNLPNMRVGGPYRVEVASGSEQPIVYEDVYLELGQPFNVNPVFGEKTADIAEVVLTSARGTNVNKTGAATNVGLKQIQDLPQANRSITEFTRLTPQANGNSFAG